VSGIIADHVFGRDGILGRRYISGTAHQRDWYASITRMVRCQSISRRKSVAQQVFSMHSRRWSIPKEKGVLIVPAEHIPEASQVIRVAQTLVDNQEEIWARKKKSKPQLVSDLLPQSTITLDSAYMEFGLREDILSVVAAYLGLVPILASIEVWSSLPSAVPEWGNSQLYHCDWADISQVKVFIHASDVFLENGPLTVINSNVSKKVRDKIGYQFIGGNRLPDKDIRPLIDSGEEHALIGPAGTVCFVDTSKCFHYGSRVLPNATARTVVIYQFVNPSAFIFPLGYGKEYPFEHLCHAQLPELQQLVLGR
jgi:hypothetical protein